MRLQIASSCDDPWRVDPAIVAAITAVLEATTVAVSLDDAGTEATPSPWRAAGRGVEAFDAYDSARRDRLMRRGIVR